MALETLKDVKTIDGFEVEHIVAEIDGWENVFGDKYVAVGSDNSIHFKIQNGPIKEVGVNGCQVDTLIKAASMIIEGLNSKFPCDENDQAISSLGHALEALENRKKNREARGVEGLNKE